MPAPVRYLLDYERLEPLFSFGHQSGRERVRSQKFVIFFIRSSGASLGTSYCSSRERLSNDGCSGFPLRFGVIASMKPNSENEPSESLCSAYQACRTSTSGRM